MMFKHLELRVFRLVLAAVLVAALLLALQISPAPAQGQSTIPDDAESIIGHTIASDATRDTSCTAGATGNCTVQYVVATLPGREEAIRVCGSPNCVTRIEFRW